MSISQASIISLLLLACRHLEGGRGCCRRCGAVLEGLYPNDEQLKASLRPISPSIPNGDAKSTATSSATTLFI
jgi:hypothetical protein